MKKFRKLLPALSMLLISALLMGSSTFAWFSMNTTVTATGMSIKAEVPTQLLIKGSATDAKYKSSINFVVAEDSAKSTTNASLTSVVPVAFVARNAERTYALINNSANWKKLKTDSNNKVDDNGQVNGSVGNLTGTDFEAASENVDYIKDSFTLKMAGSLTANNNVSVTVTATTTGTNLGSENGKTAVANIYKAIHVAFTDGTTLYEIDLGNATLSYGTDGSTATLSCTPLDLKTFAKENEEVSYNVYIWYDGEDVDCKNSNAARIDQFAFNFSFHYGA